MSDDYLTPAAIYASLLPTIRGVARGHGYAVAVHGTMVRDFDLIAVPWIKAARPAEELVEAIRLAVGGEILNVANADPYDFTKRNPQPKPHGRRAWSIRIGDELYIDLSVTATCDPPSCEKNPERLT